MKKLALCLMMLSLGLFSVGCGGGAEEPAPSTDGAPAEGGDDHADHGDEGEGDADAGDTADDADTGDEADETATE